MANAICPEHIMSPSTPFAWAFRVGCKRTRPSSSPAFFVWLYRVLPRQRLSGIEGRRPQVYFTRRLWTSGGNHKHRRRRNLPFKEADIPGQLGRCTDRTPRSTGLFGQWASFVHMVRTFWSLWPYGRRSLLSHVFMPHCGGQLSSWAPRTRSASLGRAAHLGPPAQVLQCNTCLFLPHVPSAPCLDGRTEVKNAPDCLKERTTKAGKGNGAYPSLIRASAPWTCHGLPACGGKPGAGTKASEVGSRKAGPHRLRLCDYPLVRTRAPKPPDQP